MAVSEQSLSFCLAEIRKGRALAEVAADVREKFEGPELEIAIQYLRDQHRIANRKK